MDRSAATAAAEAEPELGEPAFARLSGGGRFNQAHRTSALGTAVEVGAKYLAEQPSPTLAARRSVGALVLGACSIGGDAQSTRSCASCFATVEERL